MGDKKVNFVEYVEKDLSDYTLIEGFPGLGLVGTIGAKYLVERLKFKEYGYIESQFFIPIIRIHDGLPINPSRIYINDELKLIVLISEQIIPKYFTSIMAKAVVEWIKKKGITKTISLEGIHAESTEKQTVYGIAANDRSKGLLKKHNLTIIGDGITTGITSLILLELQRSDMEAISILGNVRNIADYKAAAELIKKLNEMLGLNINIEPLLKEAKETEKELLKHLQQLKKTNQVVEKFEGKTPMYT